MSGDARRPHDPDEGIERRESVFGEADQRAWLRPRLSGQIGLKDNPAETDLVGTLSERLDDCPDLLEEVANYARHYCLFNAVF